MSDQKPQTVEPKPWWQSKLNWVGIGLLVAATLEFLAKDEMTPDWLDKILLAAAGILVIVFRSVTVAPVANRIIAWLVAASLFLGAAAQAAEVAVLIDDSKPGSYLVTVGADGSVSASPLRIVRPGGSPTSPPTDPLPPSGTPFEVEVEKQTKAVLAAGGTSTTGAALSSVYSLVADEVAGGRIAPASALPAVKAATDLVMTKQPDATAWGPWRQAVGDALTTLQGQGSLATKEQYAAALRQVSNGLNKATGFKGNPQALLALKPANLGILDGIDLAKIVELIKLIMELLKLFGGFAK